MAAGPSDAIRVFLLDDHDVVRLGVAELIEAEPDLTVVGQWDRADGALAEVRSAAPDVAVLDVRLGDGSGIEVCRDIRSELPDVACLMFTSFADDHALVDAGMAGAAGYALKQIRGNELVDAIRKIASGVQLLDNAEVRMAMQRLRESEEGKLDLLTPQESKIFELIGEGFSNRQIADELFLAEKTVKNYVSNLLSKLGMARRTEAAAYAARIDERRKRRFE
ncbi:MAG: response regulator transcription factor [Acidimicrobiales bacterium]|nr:response regulator transcription factor [Acidimicrobiales bacterium]